MPLPISQNVSWTAMGHKMLGYDEASPPDHGSAIYSIDAGVRHAKRIVLQRTDDAVVDPVLESPTGAGYAYSTEHLGVWFVATAGRPMLLAKEPDRGSGVLAFSPDGETIAYERLDGRIALIPVNRGRSHLLDLSLASVSQAAWSPDGETLAVSGFDARLRDQIVLASSGGARRRIRAKAVDAISWSSDGKWLAYISDGGLWLLDAVTLAKRRLTDADSGITWQPLSSANTAFKTFPRMAIPRPDISVGHTLRTSGYVQGVSLDNATVVVHVAASGLHCERMLKWRPGRDAVAILPFRGQGQGERCGGSTGLLGFVAVPRGVAVATTAGGLEQNQQIAFAEVGHDRPRVIANYAVTIGGFGTTLTSLRASAGLLAFSAAYACAGPEITNGNSYRCPPGVPEGSVQHGTVFVVDADRAIAIYHVPHQVLVFDAAPGRLLLAEAHSQTTSLQSVHVVNAHGRVLSTFAMPPGTRDMRFSGAYILARRNRSLEVLTRAGKTLASYPLPPGSRFVGAAPGLVAIRTMTSLRIMRLSDGHSVTLLHSAHFTAAFSTAGIAYSYRLRSGLRRGRVVFMPLSTVRVRLQWPAH